MSVTVAIVPRERFSFTRTSLESVRADTRYPHKLIYVDGGSPATIRDYLAAQAREHGFRLIRRDCFLTPNEARNLAIAELDTEYIVFVDNDVTVDPGWLERLVACADETGAWIVGPLYMIGPPGTDQIHMAGGDMAIVEDKGQRVFRERHRLADQPLSEHRDEIRREPVEMVEFHAMLARKEVFDRLGPLDERLMSANEHIDICLLVHEAGGEIYFEPDSKVTYSPSRPKGPADRAFHLLRWSPEWNNRTLDRFAEKWRIARDSPMLRSQWRWLGKHRKKIYRSALARALEPLTRPALTWREAKKRERVLGDR